MAGRSPRTCAWVSADFKNRVPEPPGPSQGPDSPQTGYLRFLLDKYLQGKARAGAALGPAQIARRRWRADAAAPRTAHALQGHVTNSTQLRRLRHEFDLGGLLWGARCRRAQLAGAASCRAVSQGAGAAQVALAFREPFSRAALLGRPAHAFCCTGCCRDLEDGCAAGEAQQGLQQAPAKVRGGAAGGRAPGSSSISSSSSSSSSRRGSSAQQAQHALAGPAAGVGLCQRPASCSRATRAAAAAAAAGVSSRALGPAGGPQPRLQLHAG
jgi:hypothetical protein